MSQVNLQDSPAVCLWLDLTNMNAAYVCEWSNF